MLVPCIKLQPYYSISFSEDICIVLEDLQMIDAIPLQSILLSKNFNLIPIVKNNFYINTTTKIISIVGYKINASTYFVTKDGLGSNYHISYDCSEHIINSGVECLYHLYQNWANDPFRQ